MNKCEHGQKITSFCASDCCVWKEAAGCQQCMKKYHNHMGTTIYLTEEDITAIVKKYTMDNNIKPKCRLLQETIYSYFSLIKTELTNSMDVICKNMINQIGYPYLYSNNTLSTYKRLKNKQYRKLVQKEFKSLYELSMKINQKDLARQESKIYVSEMKVIDQFLNNLESMVKNYEQIVKNCQQGFLHDSTLINKINDIIRHMPVDLSNKNTHKQKESEHLKVIIPHSIKQKHENSTKESNKVEVKLLQSTSAAEYSLNSGRSPMVVPSSPSTVSRPNYSRDVSIDKKIIKQHRFISPLASKKDKIRQNADKQVVPLHQISNKTEPIHNNKEMQINEKKKILIEMMKQKQDSAKNQKDKPEDEIKKKENNFIPKKQQILETPLKTNKEESKSQIDFKLSDTSNEVSEEDIKTPFRDVQQHAFTKLPLEELASIDQQISDASSVKEQVIVIPTPPALHLGIGEISSPLLKKKSTMSKYQEYKLKYLTEKKDQFDQKEKQLSLIIKSTYSAQPKKEQMGLKQNQTQSIALLLKSLTLSANQAIQHLQLALKLADNNISAAEYLSYLYLQVNRPMDCIHLCNKMIDKRQKAHAPEQMSFIIDNNRAAALNMVGRYSQSILILEKCLRIRQKDYFYKNLGDAYFSVSIYDKAIYNYEKALSLNQSYDQAHYNLAVVLYIQQNYYNAKLAITKALEGDPLNEDYQQLSFHIETKINQL